MALTKAAVRRSMFLLSEVSIKRWVASTITSSRPEHTMSSSVGPRSSSCSVLLASFIFIPDSFEIALTRFSLLLSSHFRVSRPGRVWSRFFSHQKQLTVTPPALVSTSGRKLIPFLSISYSPLRVVGPLAASTTNLHWNRSALVMLICFSKAAGMNRSQGLQLASSPFRVSTPVNPTMPFLAFLYSFSSSGLIPLGLQMEPSHSVTPMSLAPSWQKYFEAWQPTLPNPCTMKVLPLSPTVNPSLSQIFLLFRISRVTKQIPRPVDSVRPEMPPWFSDLPVTQPDELMSRCPQKFWQVSFIQLISRSPVPKSGPGTSIAAPIEFFFISSIVYLRVTASIYLAEYFRGSMQMPPLAPPQGRSATAHFRVIRVARASTSSMFTWSEKRVPPFEGKRQVLCCALNAGMTSSLPLSRTRGRWNLTTESAYLQYLRMSGLMPVCCPARSKQSCTISRKPGSAGEESLEPNLLAPRSTAVLSSELAIISQSTPMWPFLLTTTLALEVTEAHRQFNCRSNHLVETVSLTFAQARGEVAVQYLLPQYFASRAAHLSFQSGDRKLTFIQSPAQPNSSHTVYLVEVPNGVTENFRLQVRIDYLHAFQNLPKTIASNENQLLKFAPGKQLLCAYPVLKQILQVQFQQTTRSSLAADKSERGKYVFESRNTGALQQEPLWVHGVNNHPQVEFMEVERTIQISHWGNIYIETHYKLRNLGSGLSGEFSRIDYSERTAKNSFRSSNAYLPQDTWGLYYRDQVGNITTSHAKRTSKHVHLQTQTRFMVLGGWNSNWTISYNLPSQNYLKVDSSGERFRLQNIPLAYQFNDIPARSYTLRVLLPQHSQKTGLKTGSVLFKEGSETHYSYLDFSGRPTVTLRREGSVGELWKADSLEVEYSLQSKFVWYELLYCAGTGLALFIGSVLLGRLDLQTLSVEYPEDDKII